MKIIKRGTINDLKLYEDLIGQTFKCQICGCEFEIEQGDPVKFSYGKNRYIRCPQADCETMFFGDNGGIERIEVSLPKYPGELW